MLALLYDIHGNLRALEAVLDDARARGATGFLLGGDYALFGPRPAETVELLDTLGAAEWIRGNGERWTAAPDDAPDHVRPAIAACRARLGEALVERLGALPFDAVIQGGALAVHGSPASDVRSFLPAPGDDEAELLAGVAAPRLVFGHTHLPFRRISAHGGIELVNPGSVGMPFDGDTRAAYALLDDRGSVEHRRVTYDVDATVADLRDAFGDADWVDVVAQRLATARVA